MNQTPTDSKAVVEITAKLLDLSISEEQMPGVVENFETLQQVAQAVMAFPLPEDIEISPKFEP
ncbi:hypothetical protein AY599_15700 [Leptolyngbya valderiana BDU 20041]|uniref:DUF4089 domain-containing protein n=1 Tax=Baaleninema simplex TaxID=2862350 RepID=UPI00034B0919|nr:DUF4089 domain-containing protein [Baaleninema simplex]OAB55034.1 hypothetical protein AY599_15700 [Leptolyngbya valderiana BDU 20041]